MHLTDVRIFIVRPALELTNLWSQAGENIVCGTGLVESNFQYEKQIGGGGALGYFQCEPATYRSVKIFLENKMNQTLMREILAAMHWDKLPSDPDILTFDAKFAAIICRIHYLRIKEELPEASDPAAMCNFYKKYYNTPLGKATFEKAIGGFQLACA